MYKDKNVMLFNGDCLEVMDKMIEKGTRVDAIVTDPPYKTTKRGNSGGTGGMLKDKNFINGNGGFKENNLTISDYSPKMFEVLKDGGHGYLFCNDKNLVDFSLQLQKSGFKIFKTLVWAKNNCITNMYYMTSHEYIVFFRKGKAIKINNCGTKATLNFNNVLNKKHPSEKPIDLLEVLIQNSTNENEVVLDFTMGSGSTGVACVNTGRKFIGIELDKKYYDISVERIKKAQTKIESNKED